MWYYFLLLILLIGGVFVNIGAVEKSEAANKQIERLSIEDAISMIDNKKHKEMLEAFKNDFEKKDRFKVTSHPDHFEIIVSHPAKNGLTGGREQYLLNKETGKYEMGWHEHPMEMEQPILKSDNLTAEDEKYREILEAFKNNFGEGDHFDIASHPDHFEIIVSHPEQEGFISGGAEQYFLDKETGKYEMGWHEHPMEDELPVLDDMIVIDEK